MKRNFLLVFFCLFVLGTSVASWANNYDGFEIGDATTVAEAVEEIVDTLVDQNFEITAVIDHAANAKAVGLELPPTQVILFRKIFFDVSLIRRSQTAAIDLPLKILVFEEAGEVVIAYNDPFFIAQRAGIQGLDTLLGNIANALNNFAEQGAEP